MLVGEASGDIGKGRRGEGVFLVIRGRGWKGWTMLCVIRFLGSGSLWWKGKRKVSAVKIYLSVSQQWDFGP